MTAFKYDEAFSRNLGLVTAQEQDILKSKTIAIAGMGGVGGSHLLALVRMGIENFHIADMDTFELVNFNRQAGATTETLGKLKAEEMKKRAMEINPRCKIKLFPDGINAENLDAFLDGVDVYLDGLDFFVLDIRGQVFKKCREKGIPAVTAGPIGLSTAYIIFNPKGMSFEQYFQLKGKDKFEKALSFLVGLTPRLPQKGHFVDYSYVNFKEGKGSSLSPACFACSAVAAAEIFKILLKRGTTKYAPWVHQFDMYDNNYYKVYNWLGNKNPLNRLKIKIVKHKMSKRAEEELKN